MRHLPRKHCRGTTVQLAQWHLCHGHLLSLIEEKGLLSVRFTGNAFTRLSIDKKIPLVRGQRVEVGRQGQGKRHHTQYLFRVQCLFPLNTATAAKFNAVNDGRRKPSSETLPGKVRPDGAPTRPSSQRPLSFSRAPLQIQVRLGLAAPVA